MTESDDKNCKESNTEFPAKCPICQDTGFVKGRICVCITGDLPEELKDIFGDIFSATKAEKEGKSGG